MAEAVVYQISRCIIKPNQISEDSPKRCHLTPWDLPLISANYIQKGLLFYNNPSPSPYSFQQDSNPIVDQLKESLSHALVPFFPLAGRLSTEHHSLSSSLSMHVFIDCNGTGAEFIHAAADVTVEEILTSVDVHPIVRSFFAFERAINHDGHSLPLLGVQFTELVDGFFIGLSFNHVVGDGTSFWNFFNAWSEITRKGGGSDCISNPPVTKRWFGEYDPSLIRLPFSDPCEFTERYSPPPMKERFFHFTAQSMARLKERANKECKSNEISSFQALCAIVWRSITRARRLAADEKTSCRLAIGNRSRLQPPLSPFYFGCCVQATGAEATVAEFLSHNLGWAAWLVHESVHTHTDATIRSKLDSWVKAPVVSRLSRADHRNVMITSSPRFDMYGNDFGWGAAVAVRSGLADKVDGKVQSYPGREGGGSVDLEMCLKPESMKALELDGEFMEFVSHS